MREAKRGRLESPRQERDRRIEAGAQRAGAVITHTHTYTDGHTQGGPHTHRPVNGKAAAFGVRACESKSQVYKQALQSGAASLLVQSSAVLGCCSSPSFEVVELG